MGIPDLSSYYQDNDRYILQYMQDQYRQSITLQQQFWTEADRDMRFKAGDQTLWNELYGFNPRAMRRQFQFNRIRRIINLVSGYQRRNRKTSIVTPMENTDQLTADQLSDVLQWVNNNCGMYNMISDAFEGAITTGMNLLSLWLDYRTDPMSGDIRVDNHSYNGFLIDTSFKKMDLSDANFVWTRKWMSKRQIMTLLPGRDDEIQAMQYAQNRDDKFIFMADSYQFGVRKLLPYDEFWYLDTREQKMIVDVETNETIEWSGDEENLKLFMRKYPNTRMVKVQKPTYRLAIVVNNKVMYNGPNPMNIDRLPFVGCFGYFEKDIPYYYLKIQGIVRGLRDAQYNYNRRKVLELDILESQINSGIKAKEDALIDPNDAFMSGPGRFLMLKKTAQMEDVEFIPAPDIPQSMLEVSKIMGEEIMQISGVNEELLGSADDDKAGILAKLRQGAGLTTLQGLFDNLDTAQMQVGELTKDLIINNFSEGKLTSILGKEPTETFRSKTFQKYKCQVEEGILTSTQKQMQFVQALHLQELGIQIPPEFLFDSCQIQNKSKLIKMMEEQQQQQKQIQQAQMQQQTQAQQVLNETLLAKADSDHALAEERMNKIGLDAALNVERISRAHEERDAATLDRIKAFKEIESMDLDKLRQAIEIFKALQSDQPEPQAQAAPRPRPTQSQSNLAPIMQNA